MTGHELNYYMSINELYYYSRTLLSLPVVYFQLHLMLYWYTYLSSTLFVLSLFQEHYLRVLKYFPIFIP